MKRPVFSAILLLIMSSQLHSQKPDQIHLWPGKVPGEVKEKSSAVLSPSENDNIIRVGEVTDPLMEVYRPVKPNGAAVVVCPGGGYHILAWDLEGTEVAAWLNKNGFTAFVLKYRVPDKREGALQDVQRAIRLVRSSAPKYGLSADKIGVMGFSAGGSLSARAGTRFNIEAYAPVDATDSVSCRPSFAMLIYPAYLDQGPDHSLTPELQLSKDVPPFFIFQTADDQYSNSALVMAQSLRNAGLAVELHLLPLGGHGYGLRAGKRAAESWPLLAEKWLGTIIR
jgi:acetyl esterase/lipase